MEDSDSRVERSDNPLVNTLTETQLCIFFTINPCDQYWEPNLLGPITDEIFRGHMIDVSLEMARYYKKNKHIRLTIEIHFEKANGRVHSHGVIYGMPLSYYPYGGELDKMSKRFHKVFGKPRLRSTICADFRWVNDKWNGKYISKQNYLKPCRIKF